MMITRVRKELEWAPLPLRLMLAAGFLIHGVPMLMSAGHAGFASTLAGMGVPQAGIVAWIVAAVEVLGGTMLLLGVWTRFASAMLIVVMLVALFTVHLPSGFSSLNIVGMSKSGPIFGLPGIEVNLLYIAALLALLIGGPGALSIDHAREGHSVVVRRVDGPRGTPYVTG